MSATHPPIGLSERLDLILAGLREVVATRGGLVGPLIALLCGRLMRRGLRFAALLAALRAGTLRASPPRAAGSPRPARSGQPRSPDGFGWLIRRCGWQAACYGSQLRQLLAEPEMVLLLQASPKAGRIFRPLCRMLAVELPPALALKRRRSKPAASPDAAAGRAGVSCYRWRDVSVAAEAPNEAPRAAWAALAPLKVVDRRGKRDHDNRGMGHCHGGLVSVAPRSPPSAVGETLPASLWPRARPSLPREAVSRGAGPPGEAGGSGSA